MGADAWPWKWTQNRHDGERLVDAAGLVLLECDDPFMSIEASAEVRSQIAESGEMRALLREHDDLQRWTCGNHPAKSCPFPTPDGRDCWEHRRQALLARIDANR